MNPGAPVIREALRQDFKAISRLCSLNSIECTGKDTSISCQKLVKDGIDTCPPKFYCLVAESNDTIVGYAIYYYTYSTWDGRVLFLEDFYVEKGHIDEENIINDLFGRICNIAEVKECHRLQWASPIQANISQKFDAMNLTLEENWHQYRLPADKFKQLG